ncbi:MAG: DUF4956 domain-containing protein [Bacteroidales bacterium]|nr:DUF4956 domain-containing protein [Bacteroidales bacterium]
MEQEFFGIALIDAPSFAELIIRFVFNFLIIFIIGRGLYYPATKRRDFLFTYILISAIVFLLCFLLGNVKIQVGFALGLFAIFGIIRYRTELMPIKEMTYLFLVIGVSVINALSNKKVSYAELVFTNLAIVMVAFFLEKVWMIKHESRKRVKYDNIALVKPEHYAELKADLEKRTGLKIERFEVGDINYLTDSTWIQIYYYEPDNSENLMSDVHES